MRHTLVAALAGASLLFAATVSARETPAGLSPEAWARIVEQLGGLPETKLTASDATAGDIFGTSASVSGDTVVVGAPQDNDAGSDSGSAYVFERDQGGADNWGEVTKLTASDAAANDFFGFSVSVSGDTVVVGALNNAAAGNAAGSAYVFERDQGGADNWGEVTQLTASDAAIGDEFGVSVSVSGDTLVVGAFAADGVGSDSGSAYVFERGLGGPDNWGEVTKLTASDAADGDIFGARVSVNGDSLVVGAPQDDDAGGDSGSAYVFLRDLGGPDAWGELADLTASDGAAGDRFGISVSVSGDTLVVGADQDDDAGGNSGSAYVFTLPSDLAITKTDEQTTAVPGAPLTYLIAAANLGPFEVLGATVTDAFPAELTCTWTCTAGGGATCTPGPVAGDIADTVDLPVGALAAYIATCDLDPGATGTLVNTATIAGGEDANPGNNSATDVDLITPQADLGITKTDKQTTAVPGSAVTYIVTATNFGPIDVTGATVTDPFPAVLSCDWTCVTTGGAACTAAGSGSIVESVDLPVGATATFIAACAIDPAATGALVNSAAVSPPAGITDPSATNDGATDVDALAPQADLAIAKDDGQATAVPGETTTYTIVAGNLLGPSDAPGTTVADVFSSLLTCTWTCAGSGGATCSAGPIAGNVADTVDLPFGGTATYTAVCDVDPGATGTVTNTATVAAAAGVADPVAGNDSATDVDTMAPEADLAITKDDGVTLALPGDVLTYTIVASNPGPSDALAATVDDPFPPELIGCEWTCMPAGGALCTAGPVAGDIADSVDLFAGSSATYTATCTVDPDVSFGLLSNTATITEPAGVTDPDPGDNAATDLDLGNIVFTDGFESGDTTEWSKTTP